MLNSTKYLYARSLRFLLNATSVSEFSFSKQLIFRSVITYTKNSVKKSVTKTSK
jgi:hypothetical protein